MDCIDLTDEPSVAKRVDPERKLMEFSAAKNLSNPMLQASLASIRPNRMKRDRPTFHPPAGKNAHGDGDVEIVILSDGEDEEGGKSGLESDSGVHRPFKHMRLHEGPRGQVGGASTVDREASGGEVTSKPTTASQKPPNQEQQDPEGCQSSNNSELRILAMEREARQRRMQEQQKASSTGVEAGAGAGQAPPSAAEPRPLRQQTAPTQAATAGAGARAAGAEAASSRGGGEADPRTAANEVSVLTYNVWFNEEVALRERMGGLAAVIEDCGFPDVLLLQVWTWISRQSICSDVSRC